MWIIPSNLRQLYPSVPAEAASIEELSELLDASEPLLMWKSKPLSSKTFWRAWKRVYWIRHLSGRILRPSLGNTFAEKWTSLWADIPANHSVPQANGKAQTTRGISGPSSKPALIQLDLPFVSSKTSPDISPLGLSKSPRPFKEWV